MTQAMLSAIYDESCRLGTTVNDFLDYARPRQPRKDAVVLRHVLDQAMAFLGGEFQKNGVEVEVNLPEDTHILGDRDLLYRAFYNILSNAQQALDGEGRIFIEGGTDGAGKTWLNFRDTGPGFAEDTLQKAMDPFFTTKDSGTGLGLPIVQAIVESHGGILKISNAPDGGAHIVIEFPAPAEKKEELPHE
jgi:signal transduction histidine kinase